MGDEMGEGGRAPGGEGGGGAVWLDSVLAAEV